MEETFWDNRDWDWYRDSIPFFECPDPELAVVCRDFFGDELDEFHAVLNARPIADKTRIGLPFRHSESAAETFEQSVIARRDQQRAISGFERLIRHQMWVRGSETLGRASFVEEACNVGAGPRKGGLKK